MSSFSSNLVLIFENFFFCFAKSFFLYCNFFFWFFVILRVSERSQCCCPASSRVSRRQQQTVTNDRRVLSSVAVRRHKQTNKQRHTHTHPLWIKSNVLIPSPVQITAPARRPGGHDPTWRPPQDQHEEKRPGPGFDLLACSTKKIMKQIQFALVWSSFLQRTQSHQLSIQFSSLQVIEGVKLILVERPRTGKSPTKQAGPVKLPHDINFQITAVSICFFLVFTLFVFLEQRRVGTLCIHFPLSSDVALEWLHLGPTSSMAVLTVCLHSRDDIATSRGPFTTAVSLIKKNLLFYFSLATKP